MLHRLIIASFALLVLVAGAGAQEEAPVEEEAGAGALGEVIVPPFTYHFTLEDRLAAAQACVSEASWAGGRRTADCAGILAVTMHRRRRGESFREAITRTMPRFFGGRTSRAWVLALTARPIRTDTLPGWPENYPPASHYSDSWRAVYARTQRYIDGEEPLPCSPTPTRWFGRTTDHDALAVALATGEWQESDCGDPIAGEEHATVNAFLYPVDPE